MIEWAFVIEHSTKICLARRQEVAFVIRMTWKRLKKRLKKVHQSSEESKALRLQSISNGLEALLTGSIVMIQMNIENVRNRFKGNNSVATGIRSATHS